MPHRNNFSFYHHHRGITYVYNSETGNLYTKPDNVEMTERREFTQQQAARLLMDIVYDTIHPLRDYFSFGCDTVGQCHRCGAREVV